jgi:hypothetical protein
MFLPDPLFSGSHFLCPSTVFFLLFLFPLSPFSPSHIPPPTEKPLVSPFLHFISTVPPPSIVIFLHATFTSFPSLFSSFTMVLSFFCISRSCFVRISSLVPFFSLSFPFCFITFSFLLLHFH